MSVKGMHDYFLDDYLSINQGFTVVRESSKSLGISHQFANLWVVREILELDIRYEKVKEFYDMTSIKFLIA